MEFVQEITASLANVGWHDLSQIWSGLGLSSGFNWAEFSWVGVNGNEPHWAVLAQQQFDTDVFATTRKILGDFVKSGKLWVLLIGIVVGYILKGLTSYG